MSYLDELLSAELKKIPKKPSDRAEQKFKKRYSEMMSAAAARALAEGLRRKGLKETLPLFGDSEAAENSAHRAKGKSDGEHEEAREEKGSRRPGGEED